VKSFLLQSIKTGAAAHPASYSMHTTSKAPRVLGWTLTSSRTEAVIVQNDTSTPQSKGKGKAVPLQGWSGPDGSRKLRFPDYMTTAQDGGKIVSPTHRQPLPPRNPPG